MTKHSLTKSADEPIRWFVKPRRKRATKEPQTKRDQLIKMLNAKNGAGADAIWTCRAFVPLRVLI